MTAVPMFVALQPDRELTQFLNDCKSRTQEMVGDQLYLGDPPHLTLYLAAFENPERVIDELSILTLPTITGELVGWHVFEADVLTGRNTLVCEIDAADKGKLRQVQAALIRRLAPLRDVSATLERYKGKLNNLSKERQKAVERVGFPFVGDDWQPHFSVGSILPKDWPPVWNELESLSPKRAFSCPQLKLYRLEGTHPVLVNTFDL